MSFDSRSLEHLQELGRQLPQKLPNPNVVQQNEHFLSSKSHPIETEENPEILFRELMKASPNGNIPSHLIDRLKEIESNQLNQRENHNSNQSTNTALKKDKTLSSKKTKKEAKEESLYASFDRLLLEDED